LKITPSVPSFVRALEFAHWAFDRIPRQARDCRADRRSRPDRDQRREPNRRDDGTVIGMGDHMPDFLTRSFATAGSSGE
jgi:hypothetical protein